MAISAFHLSMCTRTPSLGSCVCIRRTRRSLGCCFSSSGASRSNHYSNTPSLFLEQTTVKVHTLVLCPVLLATGLFPYEKSGSMGADKLFEFTGVCG